MECRPVFRALTRSSVRFDEIIRTSEPSPREVRVALVLTAAALLGVVLLKAANLSDASAYDFSVRYASGFLLRQGNGAKIYDVQEQVKVQRELFNRTGPVIMELHPPFEALLWAPLTYLSYTHAYAVWGVINIALLMWFVHFMRPHVPIPKQTFQYFILCFAFFPVWTNLLHGQTAMLLLIFYSLTFLSLKRREDFKAGAFLGLGLLKFQLVLPFALICLLRKKLRMMAGFVAVASLLGVLSILAVGWSGVVAYLKLPNEIMHRPADPTFVHIPLSYMPSIRGFFTVLMTGRVPPLWTSVAIALASAFLVLFTAWVWRREDRRGRDARLGLTFAAALSVSLMSGFYLYIQDLSPFLLAILLAIGSFESLDASRWRLLLGASIAVLYTLPMYLVVVSRGGIYLIWPVLMCFTLAVFALLRQRTRPELTADGGAGPIVAGTVGGEAAK